MPLNRMRVVKLLDVLRKGWLFLCHKKGEEGAKKGAKRADTPEPTKTQEEVRRNSSYKGPTKARKGSQQLDGPHRRWS